MMNKSIMWRLGVIAIVVAASLYSALPLNKKINLGLDLQGGMHLIYEVDTEKAQASAMDSTADDVKNFLKTKGVDLLASVRDGDKITMTLARPEQLDMLEKTISADYGILERKSVAENGSTINYGYTSQYIKTLHDTSIDQALETLRNRVDQFGVAEPTIQREGGNRILIQLPGVKDRERAISLIGKTARLEFHMLNDQFSVQEAMQKGVPSDSEIMYERSADPITKKARDKIPYLVRKKAEMTGAYISGAQVRIGQSNLPYVSVDFNKEGSRVFGRVTSANVGKRMAIVLDGNVYSAPVIREAITGGAAMIEGSFTYDEARDLSIVLRAGALPAPLVKLEERSVGPSLGQDSIEQGIKSAIIGSLLVMFFMLLYYRAAGINANAALVLNMIIMMGAMAYFGATLTLPGIAGIILTIGIAVDANVLVFEHVREELRMGKTVRSAVDTGFSRAFLTITDTHVTTLIAAVVLFQFGTGPIKGFAITLCIGLIASIFTSVFVSRVFFDMHLGNKRITDLSI